MNHLQMLNNSISYFKLNIEVHQTQPTDKRKKPKYFFQGVNGRTSKVFNYEEANAFLTGLSDAWNLLDKKILAQ